MATKRNNRYKIQLSEVALKSEQLPTQSVVFEFENHDDVFHIIRRLQDRNLFENPEEAIEFAVGLKLFSEVLLRNKDAELFKHLKPHFADFMKKLKGGSAESAAG
jgi:hypothetical protein